MAYLVPLFVLALLGGCGGPNDQEVTRAQFGAAWPLTVERGSLECENDAVTFTTDDGTVYAVNGAAEDLGLGIEIRPIWADNPSLAGTKKDIGPLIDAGLERC